MTRHGQIQHGAEATPLRPSDKLAITMFDTVRSAFGTATSARQHRRGTSITWLASRVDASPGLGFASLGWRGHLRTLGAPAKSP